MSVTQQNNAYCVPTSHVVTAEKRTYSSQRANPVLSRNFAPSAQLRASKFTKRKSATKSHQPARLTMTTESSASRSPARKREEEQIDYQVLRSKIMPVPHFKQYERLGRQVHVQNDGVIVSPFDRASTSPYRAKRPVVRYTANAMRLRSGPHSNTMTSLRDSASQVNVNGGLSTYESKDMGSIYRLGDDGSEHRSQRNLHESMTSLNKADSSPVVALGSKPSMLPRRTNINFTRKLYAAGPKK